MSVIMSSNGNGKGDGEDRANIVIVLETETKYPGHELPDHRYYYYLYVRV